jgi:hypothetical protein
VRGGTCDRAQGGTGKRGEDSGMERTAGEFHVFIDLVLDTGIRTQIANHVASLPGTDARNVKRRSGLRA